MVQLPYSVSCDEHERVQCNIQMSSFCGMAHKILTTPRGNASKCSLQCSPSRGFQQISATYEAASSLKGLERDELQGGSWHRGLDWQPLDPSSCSRVELTTQGITHALDQRPAQAMILTACGGVLYVD